MDATLRYVTHGMLAAEEAVRVSIAEHRANLTQCLDGRYTALCKHGLLTKTKPHG